jgi:FkbM family methyltransferase
MGVDPQPQGEAAGQAPFGACAPSPAQERVRELARRLPDWRIARKLSSLLLGPAGGRSGRPFDVTAFETQRARLHPYDNLCEKRVYLTPQHWDPKERALLAAAIGAHARDTFYFADIGANVGLYTLFARSAALAAGKRLRALCVEPDPELRRRLGFNLEASGFASDAIVKDCAVAAADGPVRLAINARNRGMNRVAAGGEIEVKGRTLFDLVKDCGFLRIDAMKLDIEGGEGPVLLAYFREAPQTLRPKLIIVEVSHGLAGRKSSLFCQAMGYDLIFGNRLNAVFGLPR